MPDTNRKVRLYVVEEQEIYRELYRVILSSRRDIELVQVSSSQDIAELSGKVSALGPDVLLLSIRRLGGDVIEELQKIRNACPELGIVLLLMTYNDSVMGSLRKLTLMSRAGGMALFLKQSLDLTEQLCSIIIAVSRGQIILDPLLTDYIIGEATESTFMKQLTAKELEILRLLAQGYTNAAIAQRVFVEVGTVEHHINNLYAKLKSEADFSQKHPRVSAARLYLEALGVLAR